MLKFLECPGIMPYILYLYHCYYLNMNHDSMINAYIMIVNRMIISKNNRNGI
jgi:hypothetical protein